jgi:alanine-synthesizing transaminase
LYPKPNARYHDLKEPFSRTWDQKARLALSEAKERGVKTILMAGSDPPAYGHMNQALSEHLVRAANEGWHMYPQRSPWPSELRSAISEFEKKYRNVEYANDDIIVTPGVAAGWCIIHYTCLGEPTDHVLVPEPAHYLWTPSAYLPIFGTKIDTSPCSEDAAWEIDLLALRKNITNKTKYIVLESPCNPTGTVFNEKNLKGVVDIAGEYNIPIIADEMYGLITFDDTKAKSIAEVAEEVPTIVLNGMSKFFMRTGWRLGYIAFHDPEGRIAEIKEVAKKYSSLYGHPSTSIPTPIIAAATAAYRGSMTGGWDFVKTLQQRRDFVFKRVSGINGVTAVRPRGTLYIFPHVRIAEGIWNNDTDFLLDFARNEGVQFVPGSFFGRDGAFCFRALLLPEIDVIAEAFDRLERFLDRHTAKAKNNTVKTGTAR